MKSLERGKKKENNHTIVSLDSLTSYRHITDLYNKEKDVVTTSSRKKKRKEIGLENKASWAAFDPTKM